MTTHHCVPSQPLCLILHSKNFWHYTKCSNFMTRSECKSSQPLYVWHNMHYVWHHIHSLWHHTTLFMTSSPLYLTSHPLYVTLRPLYLCNRTHSINDIAATLYMISHTVYMWHPTQYIYDNSSPLYDVTFTICGTSHNDSIYDIKPYMFMKYSFIRHHTQCYDHTPLCAFTATMPDITLKVFLSLHKM